MQILADELVSSYDREFVRLLVEHNGEKLYFAEECTLHGTAWARKRLTEKIRNYMEKQNGDT